MGDNDQLVLSYLALRKAVGVLGVLLPLVLAIGDVSLASGPFPQPSISDYYGTIMRNVFVGILFAIGVFLFSYTGYEPTPDKKAYEPSDNTAGNLACVFALGVALFPVTSNSNAVRIVHFLSAMALFLTLAYFALFLFTRTSQDGMPTRKKLARNNVYRVCGVVMLVCIALIAAYNWLLQDTGVAAIEPVFWLESVALWAFGWSWFVKGEGLQPLNDSG